MTTDEMDADLAKQTTVESLSARLGYWERRLIVSRPTNEDVTAFGEVAKKHALRVTSLMRAG